ncbi:MAG: NAD(P)/FAD-dependent oxidoreductase [Chromatiales bacterium]
MSSWRNDAVVAIMHADADALLIGGGPAGATLATLLARSGWSVLVLEKALFPRRKVCGEFVSAATLPLLRALGHENAFLDLAGPPVRRIGIQAYEAVTVAPVAAGPGAVWGRALAREWLDTMLLDGARRAGAEIIQPCRALAVVGENDAFLCEAVSPRQARYRLRARVVIAANGSWEQGGVSTNPPRAEATRGDLLAFKAHFRDCDLPADTMLLLAFPGGYGGLVHSSGGQVSLSCCIRRDTLQDRRAGVPQRAGEAVLAHILEHCRGARHTLDGAHRSGEWLSVGPIRPGARGLCRHGVLTVGNCAGEAHPIIAEGISMAMQGAWTLAQLLIAARDQAGRINVARIAHQYTCLWRRQFLPRLRQAELYAQLAMRPTLARLSAALLVRQPPLLNWCARASGKTTTVPAVL